MKKIAISIDEYIFETGGKYYGDNVGFDIVKRYADNFEQVRMIARIKHVDSNHLDMHNILLPWNNIDYCNVPFFNSMSGLVKNYKDISGQITEAIKGCDIALVRSPSLVGFLTLRKIGDLMPYALEVVANPYEMYKGYSGMQKIQSLIMHFIQKHFCKNAIGIAFVTKKSQQKIYEINKKKDNNTHYSSIELRRDFFYEKPFDHINVTDTAKPLIISHVANMIVGNLKGHKEVLQVAASLQKKGRKVKVMFAGDGPDVDYYKELAEKNDVDYQFLGFIDKNQLRELLQKSDFFLFPSKSEGLPKVLIEAMAVSLPCIASNVGGIPELLPTSSIFDSYDVDGMAQRILELASNKQKYMDNACLMYNTALEYESSVLALRREAFYRRLTEFAQ